MKTKKLKTLTINFIKLKLRFSLDNSITVICCSMNKGSTSWWGAKEGKRWVRTCALLPVQICFGLSLLRAAVTMLAQGFTHLPPITYHHIVVSKCYVVQYLQSDTVVVPKCVARRDIKGGGVTQGELADCQSHQYHHSNTIFTPAYIWQEYNNLFVAKQYSYSSLLRIVITVILAVTTEPRAPEGP